jgi:formate dehydrogenase
MPTTLACSTAFVGIMGGRNGEQEEHVKIVAVLYPCPEDPTTVDSRDGAPQQLLGCADNALGLQDFVEGQGHELVVTTHRDGGELEENLGDAEVLITTPFWPVYVTREMMDRAPNLKLMLLAGVGSDNMDLAAAADKNITIAEQTGSNITSVAEHSVMQILTLVRNYMPAYKDVVNGGWNIGEIARRSHDLEDKTVGLVGMGRIGQKTAMRLRPFDVRMLYYDVTKLNNIDEYTLGLRYADIDDMIPLCDVISIHAPLTPVTRSLFNRERLFDMKRGAHIVNTARGAIVDRDALVEALEEGHLGGYAGDVWDSQPAPSDHPWRTMPNHAMTPHVSGTSLEAQARYAEGVRRCLQAYFNGEPIDRDRIIVEGGEIMSLSYKYAYEEA